jgi:16S rRNA (uracil1498-N3)-methyltransferase
VQHFFVSPEVIEQGEFALPDELVHQLQHVVRARPGDSIVLLDDSGWAYQVALTRMTRHKVLACEQRRWQPQTEPANPIVLYQGLPKRPKWEWILQKGTELGVTTFAPLLTAHSVPRGEGNPQRWQSIVREAAEQSGRARLPQVLAPQPFEQVCQHPPVGTVGLMACLNPRARPLHEVLVTVARPVGGPLWLYVGPEGGFAPEEVTQAVGAGILPVSLGPRVLRTETAALALLAQVQYAVGR